MIAKGHEKQPLVLMGDFNSGPATSQMTYLMNGKAMLDGKERVSPIVFQNTLPREVSERSSTFSGWDGRTEGRQIDYVLVAGGDHRVTASEIKRVEKEGRFPSDHYPVTANVVFP